MRSGKYNTYVCMCLCGCPGIQTTTQKKKTQKNEGPEASISTPQPDISLIKFQYGWNEKELRP